MSFENFVDERMLVSRDALGKKEMKIKVLEVSDDTPPSQWKFGDRVKINKILITIKHLEKQKVEEYALSLDAVKKYLNNQPPKRVIVVPNRIINVVC